MTTDEFKQKWGEPWAHFVKSEMWKDAVNAAESRTKTLSILSLDDDTIKEHGQTILARQQGFREFGFLLNTLTEAPTFDFKNVLKESYPDELEEIKTKK
jgi:hypothetical protein